MSMPGGLSFLEPSMQTMLDWLKDVNEQLRIDDYHKSFQGLRAVTHALRDRLPLEEAVDLGAQMPMILRGAYYEGYVPSQAPVKTRHAQEFLDIIQRNFNADPTIDPLRLLRAIFAVLQKRITGGEMEDVRNSLPQDILELIEVGHNV